MNHQNKTIETSISLNSILKGTSVFLAASALILGGFFIAYAAGEVTITPENPSAVGQILEPALNDGDNVARGNTEYIGRRTVNVLGSELGTPGDTIKWKVTITGPSTLSANDIDLDEVGWADLSGNSAAAFHYPLSGTGGVLEAVGSCDLELPSGHDEPSTCSTDVGFSVDANDNFINADSIKFNSNAPRGGYTIKYELVDTLGTPDTTDDVVLSNAYEVAVTLEPVVNTTMDTGYATIQDAINDATSGDTIQVAAGTYAEPIQTLAACGNEPASLCIDKSLTLRGDSGDASAGPGLNAPVLDGTGLGNGSAIALLRDGGVISDVTIEGFVIRNYENPGNTGGIGSGVIAWNTNASNIIVRDNSFEDLGWNGVLVGSDTDFVQSGWTVQNNLINNADYAGIELTNVINSTVSGNEITVSNGNFDAGDSGVGIEIAVRDRQAGATTGGTNVTVSDNTIIGGGSGARAGINLLARAYNVAGADAHLSGVTVSGNIIDGVTPRGIYVVAETRNADAVASVETLTITNNTINDNGDGVVVKDYVNGGGTPSHSGLAINNNSITSNTTFGVNVENGSEVDAANNWWGASTGPTHASNPGGSGDAVSDNVSFSPWYTDAAMTTLSGGATIDIANPTLVDGGFTPSIDSTITRGSDAYLGRTTTYLGSDTFPTDGDSIQWRVMINGPSALTADMVDIDEVGFNDPDGDGTVLGTYHYPFSVVDDNLVASGSCVDVDDHICNNGTDAFSLDANDEFTNADKIKFNANAPGGSYTITYELVNTADGLVVGTHVVPVEVVNTEITITADVQSKTYGDADPVLTSEITSGSLLEGDELIGSLSRVAGENVGAHAITSTLAHPNYTITFVSADLTINPRAITVAAVTDTKTYDGTTDSAGTPTITDGSLAFSDTAGFTQTYDTEDVGTGKTLTPSGVVNDGNGGNNYVVTPVNDTTGEITQASLVITADSKSKVYGTENPELTASYDGFVGGEDESVLDTSVLLETTAVDASPVGTYPITASDAAGANYNITFASGTLTVTAVPITVTADDQSKNYGDADPDLTYDFSGDLVNDDAFSGALSRDAGENVGTYAITQGTLALSSNYALTFVPATLTINFNATIVLTEAGEWALISAPALLDEAPTVTDNDSGVVALLVYRNGAFVIPSEGDDELVNPLSAFYVKTTNAGEVGIKFATISSPTQVSRQLSAGWNLVGTNNDGSAVNEFSSIQNIGQNGGMVTLFVPDTYNSRKDTGYTPWGEDANQNLNANPITALPDNNNLSKYDGYWINMQAAANGSVLSFSKLLQ